MKKIAFMALSAILVGGIAAGCSKKTEKSDSESTVTVVKEEIVEEEIVAPKTDLKYTGKINNKYPVHVIIGANRSTGAYYYDKSGVDNYLRLRINRFDEETGEFSADEFNEKGERTGSFEGRITPQGIEGEATILISGKTMPFAFAAYEGEDAFPSTDWDLSTLSEYEGPTASGDSASSGDIDAWLDKYERVLNQEIALAKRMRNGDTAAAAELASLSGDLNELAGDLDKCKSEMSQAQLNRLNKLLQKAASAMQ